MHQCQQHTALQRCAALSRIVAEDLRVLHSCDASRNPSSGLSVWLPAASELHCSARGKSTEQMSVHVSI